VTTTSITWWKIHLEKLELNPIENPQHELKEYLQREVKPTTKDELVKEILGLRV